MLRCKLQKIAFAGAVLFGSQFLAQAQTTTAAQSAVTSGIVGLASTETAQLNVFNLQEVAASTTATSAACEVTLYIYNLTTGGVVSSALKTIAPGGFISLSYPAATTAGLSASAASRTEIRAAVVEQAMPAANTSSTVMPVSTACNVFPSLEIVDVPGSSTHIFTTDFRAMTPSGPQPLSAAPVTTK